jgi:hypothetical protein
MIGARLNSPGKHGQDAGHRNLALPGLTAEPPGPFPFCRFTGLPSAAPVTLAHRRWAEWPHSNQRN